MKNAPPVARGKILTLKAPTDFYITNHLIYFKMKKEEIKRTANQIAALKKELAAVQEKRDGNFFEPKEDCTYFIKSVKDGKIYECDSAGNIKERKFDAQYFIQSYFTVSEPEDWMDSRTEPALNDLTMDEFLGWLKPKKLDGEHFRAKKLNAAPKSGQYTLQSKAGDNFAIIPVRFPYEWVKAE
jgi:hypothetical protein